MSSSTKRPSYGIYCIIAASFCTGLLSGSIGFALYGRRDCHADIVCAAAAPPFSEKEVLNGADTAQINRLVSAIETNSNRAAFSSSIEKDARKEVFSVSLYADDVTRENIKTASLLPNVHTLVLGCCTNIVLDGNTFRDLGKAKSLRVLVLYGAVSELTEDMCAALASLEQLEVLRIKYCQIDPRGMLLLEQAKKLKHLVLPDP